MRRVTNTSTVWYADIPATADRILFNNNGDNQTANLTLHATNNAYWAVANNTSGSSGNYRWNLD